MFNAGKARRRFRRKMRAFNRLAQERGRVPGWGLLTEYQRQLHLTHHFDAIRAGYTFPGIRVRASRRRHLQRLGRYAERASNGR